jgi:FkbM family methyltransferase
MGKYPVLITENTLQNTPITFSREGHYFEPESIEYFYSLVKNKYGDNPCTIVDIGAQSGLYTLFAKYMPACSFYSFEPNIYTFELLQENCTINKITNVKLFNNGLGNKIENKSLLVPVSAGESGLCCLGENPLRFNQYVPHDVSILTLDSEFYHKNIPVHFIKCDTEGWEPYILEGGRMTLTTYKPEIFLEVNDVNLTQCSQTRQNLFSILESYGYKYVTTLNNENFHFTYDSRNSITNKPIQYSESINEHFLGYGSLEINRARLDHLNSLNLPINNTSVLELGSGPGLLTGFFIKKGCQTTSLEARDECIEAFKNLHPNNTILKFDIDTDSFDTIQKHDICFCYGLLYHIKDPFKLLSSIKNKINTFIVIETVVSRQVDYTLNNLTENAGILSQSYNGMGCRPSRRLVWDFLKVTFPYVYLPYTQPNFIDFPLSFNNMSDGDNRFIVIASHIELVSDKLTTDFIIEYKRFT